MVQAFSQEPAQSLRFSRLAFPDRQHLPAVFFQSLESFFDLSQRSLPSSPTRTQNASQESRCHTCSHANARSSHERIWRSGISAEQYRVFLEDPCDAA